MAPYTLNYVRQKIKEDNKEKIYYGEPVIEKPYNLLEYFDKTGLKAGIEYYPILTGWRPLNWWNKYDFSFAYKLQIYMINLVNFNSITIFNLILFT